MGEDTKELARQEAKNMLEEQLYKYRAAVVAEADQLEKEQAFQQIKEYFDQTENWLYEEGEDAPQQTYESILKSFHDKMGVFQMWKSQYLQMKAREEEKRQFLEVHNNNNNNGHGRQLLDKSQSCTRAKVPTCAVNTHKILNVPHAILVMEIMDTRDLSMPSPSQRTQIVARG